MPAPTGTFTTQAAIGQREDLANIIYNISPTDNPFVMNGGRRAASATLHEWQTDILRAPDEDNFQPEGNDTTFAAVTPTVRVGNYEQIISESVVIADTLEAVDKAGRNSELAYQLTKKGRELIRDEETIVLNNRGGDGTDPRQLASLGAWLKTNTVFNTGGTTPGADPTYTSGVPSAGRTDGSDLLAITEIMFKDVAQQIWTAGGTNKMVLAGPVNKQNISKFAGIATKQVQIAARDTRQTLIVGAADTYVTDFGDVTITADRFQRERDVWFVDPDFYSMADLRTLRQKILGETGDNNKRLLVMETTLRVDNEAAMGGIFDLDSIVQ